MTGDFDWICHFVFDSIEQYEFESSNFLNRFIDLIDDFRSYESSIVKVTPYTLFDDHEIRDQKWPAYKILNSLKKYHNLNEKFQQLQTMLSMIKESDIVIGPKRKNFNHSLDIQLLTEVK